MLESGFDFEVKFESDYGFGSSTQVIDPKIIDPILIAYGDFIKDFGYVSLGPPEYYFDNGHNSYAHLRSISLLKSSSSDNYGIQMSGIFDDGIPVKSVQDSSL
jgi:hypothetical protein